MSLVTNRRANRDKWTAVVQQETYEHDKSRHTRILSSCSIFNVFLPDKCNDMNELSVHNVFASHVGITSYTFYFLFFCSLFPPTLSSLHIRLQLLLSSSEIRHRTLTTTGKNTLEHFENRTELCFLSWKTCSFHIDLLCTSSNTISSLFSLISFCHCFLSTFQFSSFSSFSSFSWQCFSFTKKYSGSAGVSSWCISQERSRRTVMKDKKDTQSFPVSSLSE